MARAVGMVSADVCVSAPAVFSYADGGGVCGLAAADGAAERRKRCMPPWYRPTKCIQGSRMPDRIGPALRAVQDRGFIANEARTSGFLVPGIRYVVINPEVLWDIIHPACRRYAMTERAGVIILGNSTRMLAADIPGLTCPVRGRGCFWAWMNAEYGR